MHADHVVSPKVYVAVFAALLAGTGLTTWIATIDLGMWNTPVALAIAVAKALLVIVFFMHLKYGSRFLWVVFAAAFFWLLHLIAGTGADYLTRSGPFAP